MEFIIILLLAVVILDIIALRWSCNSRDTVPDAPQGQRKDWELSTPLHHD